MLERLEMQPGFSGIPSLRLVGARANNAQSGRQPTLDKIYAKFRTSCPSKLKTAVTAAKCQNPTALLSENPPLPGS